MKKINLIIKVLILLFQINLVFAHDNKTNDGYYCNDKETLEEYENLINKYPDDMNVQGLHALWLGLCLKTGRGDLSINEANKIFENYRSQILNELKEQQKKDELSKSL